jgi:hypothetical protein
LEGYFEDPCKIGILTHPSPLPGGEFASRQGRLIPLLGGVRGGLDHKHILITFQLVIEGYSQESSEKSGFFSELSTIVLNHKKLPSILSVGLLG